MRFLSLLGIALCLGLSTSPAQAKRPIPKTNAEQLIYFLNSETAFKDYALQCAGCHRFDGAGAKHSSVPDFNHSIGLFTRFPEGRSYMIRVPGAAQSEITNDDLALVLNYIVAKFSPEEFESGTYRPFTASEVGASRAYRLQDVAAERARLETIMAEHGLTPSLYLFGKTGQSYQASK